MELQKYYVDCHTPEYVRFVIEVWAYSGEDAIKAVDLMYSHTDVTVDSYGDADSSPTDWND